MKELQAAVVGLGVGEQHARAFAATAGCRLRCVHDHDAQKMARVVSELGQGEAAASFESILNDPLVDVVSLATYDNEHGAQVVAALEHGKHVFCEKPLSHSMAELVKVERAWRKAGRHLACNLVLRAAPLYRWVREAIRGGELGEIYAVDGDYLYGRLHKIIEGWRATVDDYSVTLGGGVHMVDLMIWLTGQRPTSVRAAGNRIATSGTSFRYDDFVAATYEFESGMVGRITSNFGCVHRHQHVLRIFGTKATLIYDDQGPRLHRSREPTEAPVALELSPVPESKGALIPEFIETTRSGLDAEAATRHEFAVVAACLAVDRAVASGDAVPVEYP